MLAWRVDVDAAFAAVMQKQTEIEQGVENGFALAGINNIVAD